MLKKFKDLTEKEILAIAIAAPKRKTGGFMASSRTRLRDEYPSTAQMFEAMREEKWDTATACLRCSGSVSATTFR